MCCFGFPLFPLVFRASGGEAAEWETLSFLFDSMAVTSNLWNVFESFNGVWRVAAVSMSGEFSICECFDIISMQSCVLYVGWRIFADYIKLCCGEKHNGIQLEGMWEIEREEFMKLLVMASKVYLKNVCWKQLLFSEWKLCFVMHKSSRKLQSSEFCFRLRNSLY